MPHYQFPCHYVYWQNVENHAAIKNRYMPKLDEIEKNKSNELKNPFNNCNMKYVSFKNNKVNTFLEPEDINEIIWNPIDNFIKEINSKYNFRIETKQSILKEYWFNTYEKNDFQEFHEHNTLPIIIDDIYYFPTFSGIYILNDDNEKSSIVFKSSNAIVSPFTDMTFARYFNTCEVSDIKEGSVIIFPSQLEHMVKKCVIPGRRTIAFNVFSELQI